MIEIYNHPDSEKFPTESYFLACNEGMLEVLNKNNSITVAPPPQFTFAEEFSEKDKTSTVNTSTVLFEKASTLSRLSELPLSPLDGILVISGDVRTIEDLIFVKRPENRNIYERVDGNSLVFNGQQYYLP